MTDRFDVFPDDPDEWLGDSGDVAESIHIDSWTPSKALRQLLAHRRQRP